jgi:hypothetical protein
MTIQKKNNKNIKIECSHKFQLTNQKKTKEFGFFPIQVQEYN